MRSNILGKDAAPFRQRNPRIARSLTSRLAPAAGASLAGFALGVYPSDQLRLTIAIYVATRAAEFTYNALENEGWFGNKPRWWGSWMLMPLATGQLLHAFVFDSECFPKVRLTSSLLESSSRARRLLKSLAYWYGRLMEISSCHIRPTTSSVVLNPTRRRFLGQIQARSWTAWPKCLVCIGREYSSTDQFCFIDRAC